MVGEWVKEVKRLKQKWACIDTHHKRYTSGNKIIHKDTDKKGIMRTEMQCIREKYIKYIREKQIETAVRYPTYLL